MNLSTIGTEWLLYPRGESPGTHWIGSWVDPRADLDAVEKKANVKVVPVLN
jgi:hypothetical protein